MQISEVSAPICRAAVSQASPPPFSVGGGAGHCFKLLPAAKMTLQLWVEIGCSDELWSPRAGCRVWWEYTLPGEERSDPSQSLPGAGLHPPEQCCPGWGLFLSWSLPWALRNVSNCPLQRAIVNPRLLCSTRPLVSFTAPIISLCAQHDRGCPQPLPGGVPATCFPMETVHVQGLWAFIPDGSWLLMSCSSLTVPEQREQRGGKSA